MKTFKGTRTSKVVIRFFLCLWWVSRFFPFEFASLNGHFDLYWIRSPQIDELAKFLALLLLVGQSTKPVELFLVFPISLHSQFPFKSVDINIIMGICSWYERAAWARNWSHTMPFLLHRVPLGSRFYVEEIHCIYPMKIIISIEIVKWVVDHLRTCCTVNWFLY